MDEWAGLRTAAIVVAWLTVSGGLLMAVLWFSRGGAHAIGPEDELMAGTGIEVAREKRRVTSFSSAQVGMHGLLGILTAVLITYGMLRDDDRTAGYFALLVAIVLTATLGTLMFRKWRAGRRPAVPGVDTARRERVEDALPRPVVYLHGAAAMLTLAAVVVLVLVD